MRRRDPDEMTDREREVLELLRRDFTNEQIAQRLGITLDGAKYHVSQILSKLGIATREEAAAVAIGERRRWWAAWPLWARIAGAATILTAAAGIGVLAWDLLRTEGGNWRRQHRSVPPLLGHQQSQLHRQSTLDTIQIAHSALNSIILLGGQLIPGILSDQRTKTRADANWGFSSLTLVALATRHSMMS